MKKYPIAVRLLAVNEYRKNKEGIRTIAERYAVSKSTLHRWITKFDKYDEFAFRQDFTNYPNEFKMDVLNYIIEAGASIDEAALAFKIADASIIEDWKHSFEQERIDALKPQLKEHQSMKNHINKSKVKNSSTEGTEKALRAEIERLRMENAYLKKLNALVRKKGKLQ